MTKIDQKGTCHCGKVSYTVCLDTQPITFRCNCSICTKSRTWFTPVPEADFALLRGENALSLYTFGSKTIEHYFCRHCGVRTHGRGEAEELGARFVSVSVATLDLSPEEFAKIEITYLNGREDQFQSPPQVTSYL